MSWLLVMGMEYHCTKCGWSFRVDYNAPYHMQIGEMGIFMQMQLEKIYGEGNLSDEQRLSYWEKPHFLYEQCICAQCHADYFSSRTQDEINSAADALLELVSKIEGVRSKYVELYKLKSDQTLQNWLINLDLSFLQTAAPSAYKQTIGHRLYSFPANRKKMNRQFLTEGQKDIINTFRQILDDSIELAAIVERYHHAVVPIASDALIIIDSIKTKEGLITAPDDADCILVFEPDSIDIPRNSNKYICTKNTVGIPKATTQKVMVYYPSYFNPTYLEESIKRLAADKLIDHYSGGQLDYDNRIDEKRLMKELALKLEQINASSGK